MSPSLWVTIARDLHHEPEHSHGLFQVRWLIKKGWRKCRRWILNKCKLAAAGATGCLDLLRALSVTR